MDGIVSLDTLMADLKSEVSRIRLLIDTCVHLFPETPLDSNYEDELLTVLGVAQMLLHNLERRIQVKKSPSHEFLSDPRENKWT